MRERAHQRLRLESDLRRAVEQGEIDVAYQPIVDMGTGRPVGVEALARWTHAERGPVSPRHFIAVAERNGVIDELGRHVLRTACAQAARWRAEIPGGEELTIAVNVSAKQIAGGEFFGEVREALRDTGLPPAALTVEVTESALMEESDAPGAVLATLRTLGTQVVLDDFGTGHSSLSYLRRFPIDGIKLDRSFVDGFSLPGASAVVEAIIRLGASLGLSLTAEGVETREQADRLRALHCRLGQGYLLARPLPAADAAALLDTPPGGRDTGPRRGYGALNPGVDPQTEMTPTPASAPAPVSVPPTAGSLAERLAAITHDLLGAAGADRHLIWTNPAWQPLLGWTAAELAARSYHELIHPEDLPRVQEAERHVLGGRAGERPETELRLRARDGSYRWFVFSTSYAPADRLVYFSGKDITARKDGEEELRAADERFRAITGSTRDGIISADGNGRIMFWNAGAEAIFGLTEEEALGRVARPSSCPSATATRTAPAWPASWPRARRA